MITTQPKFLLFVALTMLLSFFIYFLPALYFTGLDESLVWVSELKASKDGFARKEKGPRVLAFGGSGTLLGFSAEQFSREFKVPAYNMGLHGALGLAFHLREAERLARPGDTVLLFPEYENYDDTEDFTNMAFHYYRLFDRDFFHTIPFYSRLALSLRLLSKQHPFDSFFKYYQYRYAARGSTGYDSENINEHGDQKAVAPSVYRGDGQDFSRKSGAHPIAIDRLMKFQRWCEHRGVTCLLSFPGTVSKTGKYENYFSHLMKDLKTAGLNLIGSPEDFLFPFNYFTDTAYHMSPEGVRVRTSRLLKLLAESQWRPGDLKIKE